MKKNIILAATMLSIATAMNAQVVSGTSLDINGAGVIKNTLTVERFTEIGSPTFSTGTKPVLQLQYIGGESGAGGPSYSGPISIPAITIESDENKGDYGAGNLGFGSITGELRRPFIGQYNALYPRGYSYPENERHITYASTNLIVAPYKHYFNYENLFDVKTSIDNKGISIIDVDVSRTVISNSVGIGTDLVTDPDYKLSVNGKIRSLGIKCYDISQWADYVFQSDYKLKSLGEVESFIDANGHLPGVPSAEVVETEGLDVTNMQKIQMEKIEELTLYMIQMKKDNEALVAKVQTLEALIK